MARTQSPPGAPDRRELDPDTMFTELRRIARQAHAYTKTATAGATAVAPLDVDELAERIHDFVDFVNRVGSDLDRLDPTVPGTDIETLHSTLQLLLPPIAASLAFAYPDGPSQARPAVATWDTCTWLLSAEAISDIAAAIFAPRTVSDASRLARLLVWTPGRADRKAGGR
jgi:hypothetical protein